MMHRPTDTTPRTDPWCHGGRYLCETFVVVVVLKSLSRKFVASQIVAGLTAFLVDQIVASALTIVLDLNFHITMSSVVSDISYNDFSCVLQYVRYSFRLYARDRD